VVETAVSTGVLRRGTIAVWLVLLALTGVIVALEMSDRAERASETKIDTRSRMLLPVAVDQLGAIELAYAGALHRFERDAAGNWFYHGAHAGSETAHAHQIDPVVAARIAHALTGLGRAHIERRIELVARVNDYGVASPELIILAYRPNETQPVVQYAVGDLAPDKLSRYVQAVGSTTVVTIANFQIDNLLGLLQAVAAPAAQTAAPNQGKAQ
jgi:hypothetical protein